MRFRFGGGVVEEDVGSACGTCGAGWAAVDEGGFDGVEEAGVVGWGAAHHGLPAGVGGLG